MFKNILILSLMFFAIACSDDTGVDVQEFADQSMIDLSLETRSGPTGCYELIFPISFEMADGSILEVEDFMEAKASFKAWKEENPDLTGRPQLQYPVELINDEGEILSADSKIELLVIRKACRNKFIQHLGRRCFKLVYPVEILFPDGKTAVVNGPREAKIKIRAWRMANQDVDGRPTLVFPVEVQHLEDGSITIVNSKEEIKALKDECR